MGLAIATLSYKGLNLPAWESDTMKIETQRLILREFQLDDVESLAPIMADPRGMKFSRTRKVLSALETREKIQGFITSYRKYGFGKLAIVAKAQNQLIGYCGIAVEQIDGKDEKEIGYRLDSTFWHQGLATEAAKATIQHGFEQFKLPWILGVVERDNKASVRVLEKLGMRYVRETIFYGVSMDVYCLERRATNF
ncbi:MAG: GNAT family N-acetyltransferase [Cyanobacteria bacterium P01_F01_bin.86]